MKRISFTFIVTLIFGFFPNLFFPFPKDTAVIFAPVLSTFIILFLYELLFSLRHFLKFKKQEENSEKIKYHIVDTSNILFTATFLMVCNFFNFIDLNSGSTAAVSFFVTPIVGFLAMLIFYIPNKVFLIQAYEKMESLNSFKLKCYLGSSLAALILSLGLFFLIKP